MVSLKLWPGYVAAAKMASPISLGGHDAAFFKS
jgi:hypothetical protein